VALDAGVVGADKVEAVWVDYVFLGGMRDVQATGAVTFFAADVPLGDLAGVDVVVDGVAAVAERAGWALLVALAVERDPPVRSLLDVVWQPDFFLHVPLRGQDEVVVADLCEVALLPAAAVDEGNLLEIEGAQRIGVGEVAEDCVGMDGWVAYDVGHAGLLPSGVQRGVAALAGLGTNVMSWGRILSAGKRTSHDDEREKGQCLEKGEPLGLSHSSILPLSVATPFRLRWAPRVHWF